MSPDQNEHAVHPTNNKTACRWFGVIFALAFPSIITWGYFVFAAQYSGAVQQATYLSVKIIQFAFPLVWVWAVLREPLRVRRADRRGLLIGAVFSEVVVGAGWLVFDFVLRETSAFTVAAAKIHDKIAQFGIDAAWKYAILGVFYSLFHSLLEEYYWRWFAFRQLRNLIPLWPAILISVCRSSRDSAERVLSRSAMAGVFICYCRCGGRNFLGMALRTDRVALQYLAQPPAH
jgi:membrane protease YdiL (CAAX protease family)